MSIERPFFAYQYGKKFDITLGSSISRVKQLLDLLFVYRVDVLFFQEGEEFLLFFYSLGSNREDQVRVKVKNFKCI